MGRRGAIWIAVIATIGLAALPAGASAVGRVVRAPPAAKPAAKPYFDSRVGARRAAQRAGSVGTRSQRAARSRLRARLGRQAVVQVDALTGTARSVQRLDGALTGPAAGDRAAVATAWLRANRAALGLTAADVDALSLADRQVDRGSGFTYLRYRQSYRGIPTFDNGVRVNLDRGGRILNVTGSPVSGLRVPSVAPKLSAADATRALQANVGVRRAVDVTSGPSGARQMTRFARGDFARLVLFDGADGVRLAWHLTYQATPLAHYDAVVDAMNGAILFRQNLTKFDATQSVYPNYPGAEKEAAPKGPANGKVPVNLEGPWLTLGAPNLNGANVHVTSDIDSDDTVDAGEEITRTDTTAPFNDTFHDFAAPPGEINACEFTNDPEPNPPFPNWPDPIARTADCSWNPLVPNSWRGALGNRVQNGVQAFYLANVFHDHLAAAPIGFNVADHNFEGPDKLLLDTDDGANVDSTGLPDGDHLNNANMDTPPDGESPRMQMYLFEFDPTVPLRFRNINGGDDAATVWHEYTHGLSNRLITHGDGSGAVSSPHAGAMGEAWSDWYALDFLHRRGLENLDDPTVPGQVDIGVYSDAVFASTRFEPADCKVGDDDPHCPGGAATGGRGGFTFGDFGHVLGMPEVHSDGEIWLQTLWDLRQKMLDVHGGPTAGSNVAEELITQAMRLSPPEPSFLDMRNAILAAEVGLGNADRTAIWQVFAHRGMGFYAGAADSSDTSPAEDFNMPPSPSAPKGKVAGIVTSADTGLPFGGVKIGFGGLTTDPAFPDYVAPTTSASNGRYSLTAPAGRWSGLVYERAGWDRVSPRGLVVRGNATTTSNAALRRDWASARGGARVTATSDDSGADFDCGAGRLIDQSHDFGWSAQTAGTPTTTTIRLPQTIDISAFGLDPSNNCLDDPSSQTKGYQIQTSADGVHFATAKQGSFTPAQNGRLNVVAPTANSRGVRFVRLVLLSPQSTGGSGADFIDFSELEVFGGPHNVLPTGTLTVSPTRVNPGDVVSFKATFGDPDSKITGYDWDFDGNGTTDRTTASPTTTFAYPHGGAYTAKVGARDFRGGSGTATQSLYVTRIFKPTRLKGGKGKARFRVRCDLACEVTAKLKLSKKVRKQLGLKSRGVGSLKKLLAENTSKTLTIKLSGKAKRAMKRHHLRKIKVTLTATEAYPSDGRHLANHKHVTIKR